MSPHDEAKPHIPVLARESIELLALAPGHCVVDACAGFDGHGEMLRRSIGPEGVYIGLDWDRNAIEYCRNKTLEPGPRVYWIQSNFARMQEVLRDIGIEKVDAVFFDLGLSSVALDDEDRGMALKFPDAHLDFRMSEETGETAAEYLADVSEQELARVLYELGDEKKSRRIARALVREREKRELKTVGDFVRIVHHALRTARIGGIDSATRSAQAIRMAINHERENLRTGLKSALDCLNPEGRMAVISYHSGEDREVKEFFLLNSGRCRCESRIPVCTCGTRENGRVLTRKPVIPDPVEIQENRRARSAKLRAFQKS